MQEANVMEGIKSSLGNVMYVVNILAIFCFMYSLGYLSKKETARKGVKLGILGMSMVIILPVFLILSMCLFYTNIMPSIGGCDYIDVYYMLMFFRRVFIVIILGIIAGFLGSKIVSSVKMSSLPQLLAAFHSLVGLAAVLLPISVLSNVCYSEKGNFNELMCGACIGAYTFSASVVAFIKLITKSVNLERFANFMFLIVVKYIAYIAFAGIWCCYAIEKIDLINAFCILTSISFAYGILSTARVSGSDMPVVISFLNALSGWSAAGIGFSMKNSVLIVVGAIVGSSGTFLSRSMCKNMNRRFRDVISPRLQHSIFTKSSVKNKYSSKYIQDKMNIKSDETKSAQIIEVDKAIELLNNAKSVIIVPGYGMAVSGAQRDVSDIVKKLNSKNIDVKFAIHPVAGRMPGHMNVILAEANVPYDIVYELDEINDAFEKTDVALVVGANDITNISARTDEGSPIYGMPILNVDKAKSVIFIKRSVGAGYANIKNPLFECENTYMLLGDAKDVCGKILADL